MQRNPDNKVCESCGEEFGCGAKLDGCWCSDVQLPTEIGEGLKTKYQECLCPTCLHGFASTPAISVAHPD